MARSPKDTFITVYGRKPVQEALDDAERQTVRERLQSRLDAEGNVRVVARDSRSQLRNREQAEERLQSARARVTEAREDLENAGITFRTLTGLPVDSVSMPPDLSQFLPATLEEAEALARQNNPRVQEAIADLATAREDIRAAREVLEGIAVRTPIERSRWLSADAGGEVSLKLENLQRTGSFKTRGAYVRISRLSEAERANGVVAASAGNHAQGVALSAGLLGIKATVYMPEGAPIPKVKATQA